MTGLVKLSIVTFSLDVVYPAIHLFGQQREALSVIQTTQAKDKKAMSQLSHHIQQ